MCIRDSTWTARHGAAIVHGMVRDIWALLGWEHSALGVPVADVIVEQVTGGLRGCFGHGSIAWSAAGGPEVSVTTRAVAGEELAAEGLDGEGLDGGALDGGALDGIRAGFAPHA